MRLSQTSRVGGAGLLALVATYGIGRQAYGLFVPTFRQEFGLSLDALGFYASAAQAGFLAATVVAGVLATRYGPRFPVVSGCVLFAVGAALTASATGPSLLAVGIIAAGTSAGGSWGPFSDAVEEQVPGPWRKRALALVNAGSPVGLMVASLLVLVAGDRWRAVWWAFAAIGLVAAGAAWRVVTPTSTESETDRGSPPLDWFFNRRSVRLLMVALASAISSGAYFAWAPDTAQDAGLSSWIGAAMWASLGLAGAVVGVFGGRVVDRHGLRRPLAVSLGLVGGSMLVLLAAPGDLFAALGSAALFGAGFTLGYALVVMWSQQVFIDRPTAGFTLTIVFIAIGFVIGPSLFGLLAARGGRAAALVASAAPALLAALVPPAHADRHPKDSAPHQ